MPFRSVLSAIAWSALLAAVHTVPAWALETQTVDSKPVADSSQPSLGIIGAINIEGNQRTENNTIISYLGLKPGDHFTQSDIDAGLKNLYATGFFSDVQLLRQGDTLLVRVVENPVVSKLAFEGNDKIETKDLEKEVELKPRSIYSQDKVASDVKRILDIYRRSGRYTATVTPKIIKEDQNRVDLVYEITEGPVAKVAKISFIGNEHFDNDTLRKTLRTEETAWYKFFTDNDKFDPDRLQFDQELLRRFYTNAGYADFQVKSANAELSPARDAFYLTFVVEEGPQYKFGGIKVSNQLEGKDKPDLEKLITSKSGDIYDASKVEDSVEAMTKELGNHGYAFVDIQPRLDRDKDKLLADMTYIIKPGPRVYVERINITGNVRTLDEVIRREFRLNEGDPYNTALLQRTEQRLNNLGFFEKVSVKNEPGSAPDKTVVNVDVKEKSTGEINIGAGFSTVDGILGDVGIKESNLMGTGQELKLNFVLATYNRQAEASFTNPYFLDRELAAGFDIYDTYQDFTRESGYVSDTVGTNLRMSYALQEKLQHTMYYTIHQNSIQDVPVGSSDFIIEQEGTFITSAVGQTLAYDQRDNKQNPTTGYFASINQEVAGLGGYDRYIKHEVKASYYYPLAPQWVMSFLGSAGNIYGFGDRQDVRITNRFFLGGNSFRGFEVAGLGPRDVSTIDALGGNDYYVGTAELRFPLGLPQELGVSGALFTDAGSLWHADDHGPTVFDSDALRVSMGFGILWSSPFGPIRVDLADPVLKQKPDRSQLLNFSFGTRF